MFTLKQMLFAIVTLLAIHTESYYSTLDGQPIFMIFKPFPDWYLQIKRGDNKHRTQRHFTVYGV